MSSPTSSPADSADNDGACSSCRELPGVTQPDPEDPAPPPNPRGSAPAMPDLARMFVPPIGGSAGLSSALAGAGLDVSGLGRNRPDWSLIKPAGPSLVETLIRAHPRLGGGPNLVDTFLGIRPGFSKITGLPDFPRSAGTMAGMAGAPGAFSAITDTLSAVARSRPWLAPDSVSGMRDAVRSKFDAAGLAPLIGRPGLDFGARSIMLGTDQRVGALVGGRLFEGLVPAGISGRLSPLWAGSVPPAASMISTSAFSRFLPAGITMPGIALPGITGLRLRDWVLQLALMTRNRVLAMADQRRAQDWVAAFMECVLGLRWSTSDRSDPCVQARIEAVTSALLDDSWLPPADDAAIGCSPKKQLRDLAIDQHQLWRPLTSTRHLGLRTHSLDKVVPPDRGQGSGAGLSYRDTLPGPDITAPAVSDPVLQRLMAPFTPIEQEIVWVRYYDGARSWAEAAVRCGQTPTFGESLRRRFLRLKNAERQRRSA